MRAAIYARKSTDQAAVEGASSRTWSPCRQRIEAGGMTEGHA